MDLWNAFSAAVKQQTEEFANTIQGTDWKSELAAFQQGLKEETTDLSQKAIAATEELGHKTIDLAKQLPTVVEQSKQKAVATLEHLPASTSAVQAKAKEATTSLSHLGQQLVTNTTELFEQVSTVIHHEVSAVQTATATSFKRMTTSSTAKDIPRSKDQFNRLDADIAALQRDSSTYCEDPDDQEDFKAWKTTFDVDSSKVSHINKIVAENIFMSELQARLVPMVVEYDIFWTRYFYRVHKLEEKHAQVAELTSKMSKQTLQDDLAWESDEEGTPSAVMAADNDDEEVEDGDNDMQLEKDECSAIESVQEEYKSTMDSDKDRVMIQDTSTLLPSEKEESTPVEDSAESSVTHGVVEGEVEREHVVIEEGDKGEDNYFGDDSGEKEKRAVGEKKNIGMDDEIESSNNGTATALLQEDDVDEDWGDDVEAWE